MKTNLESLLRSLTREEKAVLIYFLENISVGEILVVREIRARYGIEDVDKVLASLVSKGLLERGEGCYNLASNLRELVIDRDAKLKLIQVLRS